MSLRSIALLIPFVLTLVVGAWILFEPSQASLPVDLKRTGVRESTGKQLSKTAQVPQGVLNRIMIFSKNKELLLYGSIAVFGILIMGAAIAGAKSTPKDKTTSALEVLKQEKEKAEHVAKLKSEFLNQVSHELRTPLAVIIGYIECITDGLYGEIEAKHQ
jgi:signal transduction histidine kinase